MQPSITRETFLDRRQPSIRWSAIFAGTALAAGLWLLLQMIGMGVGLATADDFDAHGTLHGLGIGTTVWSVFTPLLAMFAGGMFAGKLAGTLDRKVAGAHGIIVWALTALVGIATMLWLVAAIAGGIGHDAGFVHETGSHLVRFSHDDLRATDATGKALSAVGGSLLLGLAASVAGAVLALHDWKRKSGGHSHSHKYPRHTTEPGPGSAHVTAPYPPVTPTMPITDPPSE